MPGFANNFAFNPATTPTNPAPMPQDLLQALGLVPGVMPQQQLTAQQMLALNQYSGNNAFSGVPDYRNGPPGGAPTGGMPLSMQPPAMMPAGGQFAPGQGNVLSALFGQGYGGSPMAAQQQGAPMISPAMFQYLFGATPQTVAPPAPIKLSYAFADPAAAGGAGTGVLGQNGSASSSASAFPGKDGGGGSGGDQGGNASAGVGGSADSGSSGEAGANGNGGEGPSGGDGASGAAVKGKIITRVKGRAPKGSPDDGWITAQKGEAVLNRGAVAALGPGRVNQMNAMGGLLAPVLSRGRR